MVGLVLDGGSAFAQRRAEQNAADLAALAAANDLIVNQGNADWIGTAHTIAGLNGFGNGKDDVTVTVTCKNCPGQALDAAYDGVQVTVAIVAPHRNAFAGVVGMPTWDVGVTATSKTGFLDTGIGPGPFIVSTMSSTRDEEAKELHRQEPSVLAGSPGRRRAAEGGRVRVDGFRLRQGLRRDGQRRRPGPPGLHEQPGGLLQALEFGCYIAQHNNGVMNNIVKDLQDLAPITFPVPVVNEDGDFMGWASFVVTSATANGRNGFITGYFEDKFQNQALDVRSPGSVRRRSAVVDALKLIKN